MDEKKRRNVEEIVNSLKQPAVVTNRKILKPNRHIQSPPGQACNCGCIQKECKVEDNTSLNESSLLSVIGHLDVNEEHLLYKNYNFDEVRDSCTQTSKTIIQLAKLETGDMSPDSLSPTPKGTRIQNSAHSNFDNFTVDGSTSEYDESYRCSQNVARYIENIEQISQDRGIQQSVPVDVTDSDNEKGINKKEYFIAKNSLIQTFLNKAHNRSSLKHTKIIEECNCGDRANFLQQKSPLKKLIKPAKRSELKSQSYVEPRHPNFVPEETEKIHHQHTRFTVRNPQQLDIDAQTSMCNKEDVNEDSGGRQKYSSVYCQNRRCNSFMLPTLSSEQKSKLCEVRNIKRLISPIRRGRSSSPRKHMPISNKIEIFRMDTDKIPYIDQSMSELSAQNRYASRERRSLVERQGSPNRLMPLAPAADFRADMMRIDQLSLSIPSDDGRNGERRRADTISLASDSDLSSIIVRVQDNDWNVALKGLAEITEMCRTMDPDIILPYMITINQRLIELLKSPRSHVCRTACQAAGHLFESMKDTRGPEFNDIVDILLCKTADANKFIRQDANLALDSMVTHIPTFHAIRAICARGPLHKNHLVRCATVRLIICAVVIAGPDVILNPANNEFTRKRIFQNMIRFLEDKNLETRKYGERLYKVLSKEPTFDPFLKKYMDKDDLTRMRKTLKFIVGRK